MKNQFSINLIKRLSAISMFFVILFIVGSCKKDDGNGLIDPRDANALSGVIIVPNASNQNGNIPTSSNAPSAPNVNTQTTSYISSNGSTLPLSFTYGNISGNISGCYFQIEGANSYFTLPYSAISGNSGFLTLPLGLPSNVDSGQFCVRFAVYDNNFQISNIVTACVDVLRLGTGSVQISLSWNTPTDQDLYVVDPSGDEIYYGDKISQTGGQLDRDDVDGFGPENIFWLNNAPDGEYRIWVHDYEGTSTPNTVYVTINAGGQSKSFTKTTQFNSITGNIILTKNGNNFQF